MTEAETPLKILVVDDHEAARMGLKTALEGGRATITAMAEDGRAALESLARASFDVVLVDVQMKKMDGLSLLSAIRESHPDLPVVMISADDNPIYLARAAANGAQDFVLKSDPTDTLERALCHAHMKGGSHPGGRMDSLRRKLSSPVQVANLPVDVPLTSREGQVLRHIAYGLSNREIGSSLGISVETVKEHVQNILRKTGAADRTDVAVRAVRFGLID